MVRRDPLHFELKHGIKVQVPLALLTEFKCILMDDCYFKGFQKNFLPVSDPVTILDIGANIGMFTLFAKSRYPNSKIISLEPVPKNYETMLRNLRANGDHSFVTRHVALSEKKETLQIVFQHDHAFPTGGSILTPRPDNESYSTFEVPALSLTDLLNEEQVSEIDFLKCDCEGAEHSIFYSCPSEKLRRVHNIAMEVHQGKDPGENMDSMTAFLSKNGYACCKATDRNFLWASRDASKLVERTL